MPVVLIVDDELLCRNVLTMMLRTLGVEAASAEGGVEALNILRENPDKFDTVLLDIMMPDMNGIDVLTEIKNDASLKHLKVIIQSGSNDSNDRKRAKELGALTWLNKPYQIQDIKDAIAELF